MPVIPNKTMKYNLANKKNIHTVLDLAGLAPGVGNVADIVNAGLYISEGEFKKAMLAGASAVPVFGIFLSSFKKGRKSVKLYRGITGELKNTARERITGKIFGGSKMPKPHGGRLYTTTNPKTAMKFAENFDGKVLEFKIPLKYIQKHGKIDAFYTGERAIFFDKGVPREFMKRVSSIDEFSGNVLNESFNYLKKDIDNSKKVYNKLLKNKSVSKSTFDDFVETTDSEIDKLKILLDSIKK